MAKTTQTTPTPPAAVPMTTLHGFAIQIMGFIPIPKDDLRKQSEIPMILLDIQEGRKKLDAIIPYIKELEFRQQHLGRRFEVATVDGWRKAEEEAAKALAEEEAERKANDGDQSGE